MGTIGSSLLPTHESLTNGDLLSKYSRRQSVPFLAIIVILVWVFPVDMIFEGNAITYVALQVGLTLIVVVLYAKANRLAKVARALERETEHPNTTLLDNKDLPWEMRRLTSRDAIIEAMREGMSKFCGLASELINAVETGEKAAFRHHQSIYGTKSSGLIESARQLSVEIEGVFGRFGSIAVLARSKRPMQKFDHRELWKTLDTICDSSIETFSRFRPSEEADDQAWLEGKETNQRIDLADLSETVNEIRSIQKSIREQIPSSARS